MPHIIIEYSPNVEQAASIQKLTNALHAAAMAQEALPLGGIRTRAHAATFASVGDGDADNQYIYILVRLGQGRSSQVKHNIGNTLFKVLTDFTDEHFKQNSPLSLGLEVQEIEKEWTWKKNNIHQIIKDKNDDSK